MGPVRWTKVGVGAVAVAGALLLDEDLREIVHRRRPSQTDVTVARAAGSVSFPSGHTTQAFAVASVVAAHYDSLWIKAGAYGIAGLVGLSRMEQNVHYASDVLAGALIRIAVGNAVVRIHGEERLRVSPVAPVNPATRGMALAIRLRLPD